MLRTHTKTEKVKASQRTQEDIVFNYVQSNPCEARLVSSTRKGPVQIRFEIIEYLYYNPKPQPRTHIWRKATTMSYDDFQKHLAYLKEKGLVEEDQNGDNVISIAGRSVYNELRRSLPSIF